MSISDYRANPNLTPGDQQSNKALLMKPIGATRVTVDVVSGPIVPLAQPKRFRWVLIRNTGDVPIFLAYGQPAVLGVGIEVIQHDLYFVNPIPFLPVFAIADTSPNNKIFISAF